MAGPSRLPPQTEGRLCLQRARPSPPKYMSQGALFGRKGAWPRQGLAPSLAPSHCPLSGAGWACEAGPLCRSALSPVLCSPQGDEPEGTDPKVPTQGGGPAEEHVPAEQCPGFRATVAPAQGQGGPAGGLGVGRAIPRQMPERRPSEHSPSHERPAGAAVTATHTGPGAGVWLPDRCPPASTALSREQGRAASK